MNEGRRLRSRALSKTQLKSTATNAGRVRSIRPVSDVKKVLWAGFLFGAYSEMKLRDSSPKDTRAWTKRPSSSQMILSILCVSFTKMAVPPLLLV